MDRSIVKESGHFGDRDLALRVYPGFENPQSAIGQPGGFASHWHEEMEIILLPKGEGLLSVDGKDWRVRGPALCFIHPGEIHAWQGSPRDQGSACALVFAWDLLGLRARGSDPTDSMLPAGSAWRFERVLKKEKGWSAQAWKESAALVKAASGKGAESELYARAALLRLTAALKQAGALKAPEAGAAQRDPRMDKIKKALRLIAADYARNLGIDEMAAAAGLSRFHFCRLFKQATRATPARYLNSYRLRRARQLLADTSSSVGDIALACGFSEAGYFIRAFRRDCGQTPGAWRKRQHREARA